MPHFWARQIVGSSVSAAPRSSVVVAQEKQTSRFPRLRFPIALKPCSELNVNGKVLHDTLFHIMFPDGSDNCHDIVPLDSGATSMLSLMQVQGQVQYGDTRVPAPGIVN